MRGSYDAKFPVYAAWALEFAPVNVSVVFLQPRDSDFLCIGSQSWYFDALPLCVARARSEFPWVVSTHVLPHEGGPRSKRVWQTLFEDLRVFNIDHAPELEDGKRMVITQGFLSRVSVDTTPRPWDENNNAVLLDSLNGYRVKELASHADSFTTNVLGTHELYLTRALENFAAWEWKNPSRGSKAWGRAPDYTQHDRAVIAGGMR
jgi:hypothetical protein